MTQFEFVKQDLLPFLNKHKYTDIDDVAFVKFMVAIEVLIFNLLNNVLYVTRSLKLKTIKKEHFMAVLQIMKDYTNGKAPPSLSGGSLVMPSEYYGSDSGRYFDADVVSAVENHPWSDPSVTRVALDSSFDMVGGSAMSLVSKNQIKNIIEKYKKQENTDFKLASPAYDIIASCLSSNIHALLKECVKVGGQKKNLTMAVLYKTLNKNAKQFAHLTYVWKN